MSKCLPKGICKENIGVVVVTYGERARFVAKVVERVISEGIKKVCIVDNGSPLCNHEKLKNIQIIWPKNVILLHKKANSGSAGGFRSGIDDMLQYGDFQYIWLLDDDNVPEAGALLKLIETYKLVSNDQSVNGLMLSCVRNKFKIHREIVLGCSPDNVINWHSSFMGFNLIQKLIQPVCLKRSMEGTKYVDLPFSPYGGLCFHRSVIDKIGLPEKDYFIYADDLEFSNRIIQKKGRILLVKESRVDDIDDNWGKKHPFPSIIFSNDDDIVFYRVRNHSHFDYVVWKKSNYIYYINKYMVLTVLLMFSLMYGKLDRYKLILSAVKDGEKGRLGRVRKNK